MKWRVKFLISLAIVPLLLLTLITSSFLIKPSKADSPGFTQKVVAVVYDNSGSMSTDNRSEYAKYAMQGFMSVLDSKDSLMIFPLNTVQSVSVDLTAEDRNKVVSETIEGRAFRPMGTTPATAIGRAVSWLSQQGLRQDEVVEGKEFWLVILSDGEFDGSKTTSQIIRENISGYVGLQTVYFGMCVSSGMRIDDLIEENSAVSAYYTSSASEIIQAMQDITNRTTGRYTMTTGIQQNGAEVEIDLSTCGFSVVSVAVLAQGSSSNVKLNRVECSTSTIEILRPCSISISSTNVNMSGYSAMLSPSSANGHLNGDKIKLVFDSTPQNVTILLEPAIKLDSSLQYFVDNEWKDVSEEIINTQLKKGTELRVRYRLLDRMTNKDLTGILTDVTASVSYRGTINSADKSFELGTGKNEVALSVKVNISGSSYTLYNAWICDIDENPTFFRIEASTTKGYNGNANKVKVDYTIYYDDIKLSKSDLEGSNPKFKWEVQSITNSIGENIQPDSQTVNSDGTVSVIYSTKPGEFGAYSIKFKVVCNENKRSRTNTQEVKYYPTALELELGSVKEISLSSNQLKSNVEAFEFTLSAGGYPLSFDSGVVEYTLMVDGTNVTQSTVVDKNKLSFIPDDVSLTGQSKNIGDKKVKLQVWSIDDPSVKVDSSADLKIFKPTYVIEMIPDTQEVDIYDLTNCDAKVYFRVGIDGGWLTEDQLREGLQDRSIRLDSHPFGWILLLPIDVTTEVTTINGDAVICASVGTGWGKTLSSLFASFVFTGEKTVTLIYGDAVRDGTFNLLDVSIVSRIWRWVVIILTVYFILHVLLWILGFAVAKSLPKGVMIKFVLNQALPTQTISYSTKPINMDGKEKARWHLKRFIPFKEFMNQESVSFYGCVKLIVSKERERRMTMIKAMNEIVVLADDEDKTYLDYIEYKRKWRNYQKGTRRPSLDVSTKKLNYLLEDREKEYKAGRSVGVNETLYATKDEKGRISMIIFFVQTK